MPTIINWIFGIFAVLLIAGLFNFKYLLDQLKSIGRIFKNHPLFFYTLFIDLIWYICLFLLLTASFIFLQKDAQNLGTLDLDSIKSQIVSGEVTDATTNQMANAVDVMKTFFIHIVVFVVIFLLIALILYTIFKGFIWAKMTGKKMSKNLFMRYLGFNLILLVIAIILISILSFFVQRYVLDLIIYFAIVFVYFGNFMTMIFMKEDKIFRSIGRGFVGGLKYLPKYIVPLTFMFTFYILVYAVIFYVTKLNVQWLTMALYWILLLALFTFIRLYFYSTFISAKKKNL